MFKGPQGMSLAGNAAAASAVASAAAAASSALAAADKTKIYKWVEMTQNNMFNAKWKSLFFAQWFQIAKKRQKMLKKIKNGHRRKISLWKNIYKPSSYYHLPSCKMAYGNSKPSRRSLDSEILLRSAPLRSAPLHQFWK